MKQLLSPRQVAEAIGVSESSVKRWCDNGALATVRTAGGHRRLRLSTVAQFVRSGKHALVAPEAIGLVVDGGDDALTLPLAQQRLVEGLVAGDAQRVREVVLQLYLGGHSVSVLGDEVIAPAFHSIGDLWECGDVHVYQERRSCELCLRALRDLANCQSVPPETSPVAIGATLTGDLYSVAVTLAEQVLRDNGWNATLLGGSLSADAIAEAIVDCRPRLVWISVSFVPDEAELIEAVNTLSECATRHDAAVVLGGRALGPELRRLLRYSAFCDTFQHLEQFAASL